MAKSEVSPLNVLIPILRAQDAKVMVYPFSPSGVIQPAYIFHRLALLLQASLLVQVS
jgi:hypothetical protein